MSLRHVLQGTLLALAVLFGPSIAYAACTTVLNVCNATDLVHKCCSATTCTIDAALTVSGPVCDLDFGSRKVTLTGSLGIGSSTVSIEARSLSLKGPVTGAGSSGSGTLNITLTGGENPALSMGGSGLIDLSALGRGGGSLTILADGPIVTQGQGFKANGLDPAGAGGSISVTTTAGDISIGDLGGGTATGLLATGGASGDGGSIRVDAAGNLVLGQDRIISVSAGGNSEGLIDVAAGGNATFKNGSTVSADGLPGSGASGGTIDVIANAVTVLGNISADGGTGGGSAAGLGGDGGVINLEARTGAMLLQFTNGGVTADSAIGGDGGSISVRTDALTNVGAGTDGTVQVAATLSAQGFGQDDSFGGGGSIDILATGEIQVTRPVNVNGAGGAIGEIDLHALRDVTIGATVSGSDPGGGGYLSIGGHSIFVEADLQFQGSLGTGGASGGTAALVADTDVLIAHPNTVDVSGSGTSDGGRIDILANRNVLIESGGTLMADGGGLGGGIAVSAGANDQTGDLTVNGNVFARGSNSNSRSSVDLKACSLSILGTVDSRGDPTSVNTFTARKLLNLAGAARVFASRANVAVLGGGVTQSPLVTVTPAVTIDQRTPCTARGVPADCLMPCPTCGNGQLEFPETCDPGASTDRCATGCAHCRVEDCSTNVCLLPDCDPIGGCRDLPKPAGTPCDDANKCTTNGTCGGGSCEGGYPLNCDDGVACTIDTCTLGSGCHHMPEAGLCDDQNTCTFDACDASLGCLHTPISLCTTTTTPSTTTSSSTSPSSSTSTTTSSPVTTAPTISSSTTSSSTTEPTIVTSSSSTSSSSTTSTSSSTTSSSTMMTATSSTSTISTSSSSTSSSSTTSTSSSTTSSSTTMTATSSTSTSSASSSSSSTSTTSSSSTSSSATSTSSTTSTTRPPCASARCILDDAQASIACVHDTIPPGISRKLHHAADVIEAAPEATPTKAKRLYRRAESLLIQTSKNAQRAAKAKHPKLSIACAATIQAATSRVVGELPISNR